MTTVLSFPFFEPTGSLALHHAADLVKVEVYAILATAGVFALARYRDALNASFKRAEEKKSLLFSELAHGVANNFAAIAALISLKSLSMGNFKARAVLDEAIEQIKVMGRVHARLRAGDQEALLDSEEFFGELCNDLRASVACGRSVSIECKADSLPISMDQASSLGLIVNELVTNAIKHAFPHGRTGRIRVAFEAFKGELRLRVEDDGAIRAAIDEIAKKQMVLRIGLAVSTVPAPKEAYPNRSGARGSRTRESLMDAPVEGQIAHSQPRLSQLEPGRVKFVRFRTYTVRLNVRCGSATRDTSRTLIAASSRDAHARSTAPVAHGRFDLGRRV